MCTGGHADKEIVHGSMCRKPWAKAWMKPWPGPPLFGPPDPSVARAKAKASVLYYSSAATRHRRRFVETAESCCKADESAWQKHPCPWLVRPKSVLPRKRNFDARTGGASHIETRVSAHRADAGDFPLIRQELDPITPGRQFPILLALLDCIHKRYSLCCTGQLKDRLFLW